MENAGNRQPGRLLTVDDNAINRFMLTQHLRQMGHEVEGAENGRRALEMLAEQQFDMVLLDLNMPEMDGHQVLALLNQQNRLKDLPVLVISSMDEVTVAAQCIEAGAEDYLTKPVDPILLRARVNVSLEKKRLREAEVQHLNELLELRRSLEQSNQELLRVNSVLENLAFTDTLTNLPNRRHGMQNLNRQWELFSRSGHPFGIILCDIDHFKSHNDTCGHDFGDLVLQRVGRLFQSLARASDLVCRFGGEEFLVLCPETDRGGAEQLAERLRAGLAATTFENGRPVTASFGVAFASPGLERVDRLLKAADEALYQAKERGRNTVVTAT